MSYTVTWTPLAEQQLATEWLAAPDRGAVTSAVAWLDDGITRNPLGFGDPLDSSVHRVAYRPPVGIEYEVIEDDKRVIVRGVFFVG